MIRHKKSTFSIFNSDIVDIYECEKCGQRSRWKETIEKHEKECPGL